MSMNSKPNLVVDAWMREAREAEKLVEDMENRVRVEDQAEPQQHRFSNEFDRVKLSEVGVKLDRLESLLRNPPSKPVLTDEDKEYRWKMLSDIQLRTKSLAVSLYSMPSPNSRKGGVIIQDAKENNGNSNGYDHDQTKAISTHEESELVKPLLSNDAAQSRPQIKHWGSFISVSLFWKICWIIGVALGSTAFLFILFIICAVL